MFLSTSISFAQKKEKDSIKVIELKEVILIGKKAAEYEKNSKSLSTIEAFLHQSSSINMIKRGAYAWEPIINNMPTERTLVTIDGMRIFGACTDKMDPITSYIEVTNLSEAVIQDGQSGSLFGNTIGGSVDLKRNKPVFGEKKLETQFHSGFETNNSQKILGSSVNFKNESFYFDLDIMSRNAENYSAANHQEVLYSQFNKLNFSTTFGFRIKEHKLLETSIIYDKATDVGYPALPMDVSLAEAFITSIKYEVIPKNSTIKNWETKIYFNTIKHEMDDTTRPNVPIHMDMPGWSETFGYYSKLKYRFENHHFLINLNSFYNKSLAEMTMYPNNPNENLMFMLTWPDVRTLYNGVFLEDTYDLNPNSNLTWNISLGSHINSVASQFGLESLQIFYPEMSDTKSRFLKSFGANYHFSKSGFHYHFGVAYSERAPSVSEGYGFYLFNSFDGFDNIGNPNLKNESAIEGSFSIGLKKEKLMIKANASYFYFYDYIIAQTDFSLSPMTIGANGVRVYSALDTATIFNTSLSFEYFVNPFFTWNLQTTYAIGKTNDNENLPFISPFSYTSSLRFKKNKFTSEIQLVGNATQSNFNAEFGEDQTPNFAILNINAGYQFKFGNTKLMLKTGIENVFDKNYSTYADWNNIPRMGRNMYVNLNYLL